MAGSDDGYSKSFVNNMLIPTLLYLYLYFLSDTFFYLLQGLSKAPVLLEHCKASLAYVASAGEIRVCSCS